MSPYVIAAPEALAAASSDLASIRETILSAAAGAAPATTSLLPAAQDEISRAVSKVFGAYAQQYQALNAQAGQFHQQFVQALNAARAQYTAAEAANADPLQGVIDAVNAPVQALTGRPLIGNGANGADGSGPGGAGQGGLGGNGGMGGNGTAGDTG
ncbi:PE family protein, partial [Mycobacterium alsense]|uniref:PE family protein n=1 Tax=Mycobacterium alsense TaxID=324058 RepID=UPI000AA6B45C